MSDDQPITSEAEIIRDFLRPLACGCDAALNLEDDAACLKPKPGTELVITKDTLVGGVHFLADDPPRSIGIKAAAVNVSDLTAKGARSVAFFLSLALPDKVTRGWMGAFTDGLAGYVRGQLAGGDIVTTNGPLTISITAIGEVPEGKMIRRTTAQPEDRVYVTGSIGTSAAGLRVLLGATDQGYSELSGEHRELLISTYRCPMPPIGIVEALRTFASASMDLSDGLLKDAARMCVGSGVGMSLDASSVPLDEPVRTLIDKGTLTMSEVLSGGDDYQVLFTVPEAKHDTFLDAIGILGLPAVTYIGQVTARTGDAPGELIVRDADGKPMVFEKTGHDHF